MNALKPVVRWLPQSDINQIYSSQYWNDLAEEKKKAWWILGGDYDKCLEHLHGSGLMSEYQEVEKVLLENKERPLKIADLAAGIGWASALLSKNSNVVEVNSVEISEHRLNELFAETVKMLDGNPNKIQRYLGSFYDLRFGNESMDIVFMSQAFHHADKPFELLLECDRVLKFGGRIVLIGEHYFSLGSKIIRFFQILKREGRFKCNFHDLFPTDHDSGDHYYRPQDYQLIFRLMGYETIVKMSGSGKPIYLFKKTK
jgi:SAM-dependent methyltransferase